MVDTQLALSSDNQFSDCLTKARLIVNPIEGELCLPRFRQAEDLQRGFCCRSQTIARSLVLVTWALWLREKSAYCSRGIRIGNMEKETTEIAGTLASTCALSINTLGMVYGENEELLAIELSLLEDAVTLNPRKTAAIIAWGFPIQRILTRYLKRYNILRQAIQQSSVDMSFEDIEHQSQQLRTRVMNVFHRSLSNFESEEPTEIMNSDIDVLVACSCDQVSLQIMSVLAKCPFEVVATSNLVAEKSRPENSTPIIQLPENSRDKGRSVSPSTGGNEPQARDSSISRDEVIALLQAQTKHLEEKMQAVSISGRSMHRPSSHEDIQNAQAVKLPFPKHGKTRDNANETTDRLTDSQRIARISLQVRDLGRHRYTSASSEAEAPSNPLDKPMQRHDSVRNALKLFRLRQENCVQPPSEKLAGIIENGESNVGNMDNSVANDKTCLGSQSPAASTRRDKLNRASSKRKPSRSQRSSENQDYSSSKESVYPLRLEYGVDSASLKLLGRNSQQYNPSVKRRQFVHHQRERCPKAKARTSNTDIESKEVVKLKTAGAQTNDLNNSIEPVLSVSVPVKKVEELLGSEQDNLEPEKGSPVVQECDDIKPVSKAISQKGVSVQCRLTENGCTKGARKGGPPSLKIIDKFPVWVDLGDVGNIGTRSHFKEKKKFLQVARFGDSDTMNHLTNNDTTESSTLIIVHREAKSEDGREENQSDNLSLSNSQAQDDLAKVNTMKAMYRARYREQYPAQERRRSEAQEGGSGMNSLIDMRDDMQRMTQRLRELETCANSIDEQFKVSQKRLSRIGDPRVGGASQSRLLQDIDEVLEITEEDRQGERETTRGLLSKNATSNLNAAKYVFNKQQPCFPPSQTNENLIELGGRKILETIEQLAISADD
ncbi:hypothetical protein P3T76_013859 [Phytophthora citrophthora]|uniref:Uncharacterized protein n=1 Tax=Phytophthora citrophthora TaxID=4793 RepID=A0AAD9G340_9STRA|nr:hypothetical protein P3T76_013859 [Phytophthora citrophthora]